VKTNLARHFLLISLTVVVLLFVSVTWATAKVLLVSRADEAVAENPSEALPQSSTWWVCDGTLASKDPDDKPWAITVITEHFAAGDYRNLNTYTKQYEQWVVDHYAQRIPSGIQDKHDVYCQYANDEASAQRLEKSKQTSERCRGDHEKCPVETVHWIPGQTAQ
jgi:hypothetical protein